jgi:CheY-like chemotaxis protein
MEEALQYLNSIKPKRQRFNSKKQPQLILDLNMPVMGVEFLDCFSSIDYSDFNTTTNVVILSSTIDPEDLEKANKYLWSSISYQNPLHSRCWITYQIN